MHPGLRRDGSSKDLFFSGICAVRMLLVAPGFRIFTHVLKPIDANNLFPLITNFLNTFDSYSGEKNGKYCLFSPSVWISYIFQSPDYIYSFTSLPLELFQHVLSFTEYSRAQILELRQVSKWMDANVANLLLGELDDALIQDRTRTRLPDFANVAKNWRHPEMLKSLRLITFKKTWYTKDKVKGVLSRLSFLRSLSVSGDALDDLMLQHLMRVVPTSLELLELDYFPPLSSISAPVERFGGLQHLKLISFALPRSLKVPQTHSFNFNSSQFSILSHPDLIHARIGF
jgi:hypothetical protein